MPIESVIPEVWEIKKGTGSATGGAWQVAAKQSRNGCPGGHCAVPSGHGNPHVWSQWCLGETGPLSQGVQARRKALRTRHINGIEVRRERPRGFKKRPREFK
jgi:hypothetical protein